MVNWMDPAVLLKTNMIFNNLAHFAIGFAFLALSRSTCGASSKPYASSRSSNRSPSNGISFAADVNSVSDSFCAFLGMYESPIVGLSLTFHSPVSSPGSSPSTSQTQSIARSSTQCVSHPLRALLMD
ncbi:5942_t:CDS:2 [Acaulospora colombiana]|uniref:5942_t:CDS:1 n=1 Tax=Acaulospora colombiana TaxID=27376 RepID=A0ACA9PT16_9GLOM|nr:5942_t:CDS:2 [Acaulospora colombiana]